MVPTGEQHHQPTCPPMSSTCVRSAATRGLADLPDGFADLPFVSGARDLRGHDDSDELAVVDDRQSADLTIGHHLLRVGDVVVRTDRDRIGGHNCAHPLRLRIASGGDPANDDVTVGDDPDETTIVHDRDRATVFLLHAHGDLAERGVRLDGDGRGCHELAYVHEDTSGTGAAAGRVPPLGRSADLEDLGPADGADSLGRGPPILHGDLLRVLYLARGLALDAIACGQRSTSAGCLLPQRTLAPWLVRGTPYDHKTPSLRTGFVVRKGRVGISCCRTEQAASAMPIGSLDDDGRSCQRKLSFSPSGRSCCSVRSSTRTPTTSRAGSRSWASIAFTCKPSETISGGPSKRSSE